MAVQVNQTMTLVYWRVGKRINEDVLQHERAAYGKAVIPSLSDQLVARFGRSFTARNLRRMMQFAEVFPDQEIVTTLSSQLRGGEVLNPIGVDLAWNTEYFSHYLRKFLK